jgi:hypothetical protein
MHSRARWRLCCLVIAAAACGDGTTAPAGDPIAGGGRPGIAAMAVGATGEGYHLATDQDDYFPGDTVRITGGGWPAGDTLDILLEDEPATQEPHRWTVVVDGSGEFADSTYVVDQADLGVTFTMTATSRTTGQMLALSFTDAVPQSLGLSPATVAVLPGTPAQYLATIGMGGSVSACTVTMEMLTALPAGITASFSNSPFTATNQSFTSTFTLSTSPTLAPGNYTFRIRALRGPDCEPAPSSPTVTGLLVIIGPPAKVGFGQHPSTSVANQPISPGVTVRVLDAGNNVVPNSSASITLAFGASPAGGTLAGTLSRTAVNGIATFSDLSVDRIGSGYTLAATSPGLSGATSATFTVNRATPAKLGFVLQPSSGSSGTPWPAQPRVAIQDVAGNTLMEGPGSGAAVTLALVGGTGTTGATLGCTTNPVLAVSGVATFTGCRIDLVGRGYQLRASSGTLTPALSALLDIAPLNRPPSVDAGGPYTIAEGGELLLSPSVSDPDGDPVTYEWAVSSTGMDPGGRCTFADEDERSARIRCTDDSGNAPAGAFAVTLEVSDGKAPPVTDSAELTVSNALPVLSGVTLPQTVVVGQSLDLREFFTDAGVNDTHLGELDCGEGYEALVPVVSPFHGTCSFRSVGPRTIRVRVADDDGGAAVRTYALTVAYNVEGFFEPVARSHRLMSWRAGQAIPLKWRVTDYQGRPVLGLSIVRVKSAASGCGSVAASGSGERAAGPSGLRELGDGRYEFVWKTPASYAGTCRAVWLEFAGGYATAPLASLEFKP